MQPVSHKRPATRALALLALAATASLVAASPVRAAAPASVGPGTGRTTARAVEMSTGEALALAGVSTGKRAALMRGEIVEVEAGAGPAAAVDSALSSRLAMWVPYPLDRSVLALGKQRETAGGELVLEVPEAGPVPELPLAPGGVTEVERILSFSGGRTVNLSTDEIASLRALDVSAPLDTGEVARFSRAFRELLAARLESYRRQGLPGIAPYSRGAGKTQAFSDELAQVTRRAVHHMTRFFPEFCSEIEHYPRTGAIPHRFLLVRDTWDDRPQFILVHSLTDITASRAAFLHREFFVSQGYDAMQVFILAAAYRGGTLISLTTDVLTDQVTGFGSGVLQWVGRKRVRKAAEQRLIAIRAAIETMDAPGPTTAAAGPAVVAPGSSPALSSPASP